MVEPINLNKARKARARAEKEQRARENRIKHGRTKAEKTHDRLQSAKDKAIVDSSKRDS